MFALLIERLVGYPGPVFSAIGHPVVWIGGLITRLDQRLNLPDLPARRKRGRGVVALLVVLAAVVVPTGALALLLRQLPCGWLVEALLATSLLAQKQLGEAVGGAADGLDRSLGEGRAAVRNIVGRDPDRLEEAGVARAAVESLAENASDGVIAPLFWLLVLGLPGIAAYKAVNTLDSMIGHKSERYLHFGWASARFDDLVNWMPARLTGMLFCAAARFTPGADAKAAWATMLADAGKHDSPNAGWPEAAVAGAFGFALGGPRSYDGEVHDLPQMGEGRAALAAADIRAALKLYANMLNLALAICAILAAVAMK